MTIVTQIVKCINSQSLIHTQESVAVTDQIRIRAIQILNLLLQESNIPVVFVGNNMLCM